MSNDQDSYQEGKKIPMVDPKPESGLQELGSDDIIELTDVVSESKDSFESDADAPLLLDEEKPDASEPQSTEDVSDWDMDSPSAVSEPPEEEKEVLPENDFSAMESSDFKFEDTSAFEAVDTEPLPEQSRENLDHVLAGLENEAAAFEKPEDILAELEKDDSDAEALLSGYDEPGEDEKPSDMLTDMDEDEKEDEKPDEAVPAPEFPGISEEKMKALLTEVVQETVDRAVRETVAEVAEKVILEAIDALKKSIASSEP